MRGKTEFTLQPLTGKVKTKKFGTIDLESKDGNSQKAGFTRPFLAGMFDGEDYESFRNVPDLTRRGEFLSEYEWEARGDDDPDFESAVQHLQPGGCVDRLMRACLAKKYRGYIWYAHAGGTFDFLHLLPWLSAHKDEFLFRVVPIQSAMQALVVTHRKLRYKVTFLDSFRVLPMGLGKILKAFNLGGKVEHDLEMHEDRPEWDVYLRGDCERLHQALVLFTRRMIHDLGGDVGITAPATSMKLFRRRYLQGAGGSIERHLHFDKCGDSKCTGCLHKWIRKGYYGGRTEIFHKKLSKLHYYDFNSSYPASMLEDMPVGRKIEVYGKIHDEMRAGHVGFAEVTVRIPVGCYLPPLPIKADSGKLVFPVGTFSGVWNLEELDLLDHPLVRGEIVEVRQVVWYEARPVFKEMVEELYKLRDKSRPNYDEGLSELAKLMLNSLYGKFGMNNEKEEIVLQEFATGCALCGVKTSRMFCGECEGSKRADVRFDTKVWYRPRHVDAPYIIPQISSHITSLSRKKLFLAMAAAYQKGGDLMMCDTDSVLTTADMPSSTKLGALKDEYPGKELECWALQPKVYMLTKPDAFLGLHGARCPDKHAPVCQDEECKDCAPWEQPKTCKGCETQKVACKGIPKDERTPANFHKLAFGQALYEQLKAERALYKTGEISRQIFKARERVYVHEMAKNGTVSFRRLEKVRSMARTGFTLPPRMVGVKKRLTSAYDKRVFLPNGDTRPLVFSES